jgi:glucosamine-phosphate N-acetyltransferase
MPTTIDISGNSYSIREIKEQDVNSNYINLLSQLSEIDDRLITQEKTKNYLDTLDSKHKIFVIENLNNRHIVGSGTILIEEKIIHNYGKVGHIEDIVIDHSYRNNGLGKILLEYLTDYCIINNNCYKCILDCNYENINFYKNCGYKENQVQMSLYSNANQSIYRNI